MGAQDRLSTARRAAAAGGELALELFRSDLTVETKTGKTDLVTRADREAQAAVVEAIRADHPEEPIVGEEDETAMAVPEAGPAWIVDPIDGTNNYVRGMRGWATSVAAVVDGETVAAMTVCPALGDRYVASPDGAFLDGLRLSVSDRSDPETFTVAPTIWWGFDRREEYASATRAIVTRFGDLVRLRCAQLTLAHVAAGALDGTITNVVANPWDSVAGVSLVRQAGGTVTDVAGEPWRPGATGLVASNGRCHDEVLAAARDIAGE
jgi:myo-inositol-1(or 4)-monophosphatase